MILAKKWPNGQVTISVIEGTAAVTRYVMPDRGDGFIFEMIADGCKCLRYAIERSKRSEMRNDLRDRIRRMTWKEWGDGRGVLVRDENGTKWWE